MPGVPHLAGVVALMAVVRAAAHPLARAIGGQVALAPAARDAHGRADGILGDALENVAVGASAAGTHHNGVGAELLRGRGHLLADNVQRLIPADGHPLVGAAHADTSHGVQHVARTVD